MKTRGEEERGGEGGGAGIGRKTHKGRRRKV